MSNVINQMTTNVNLLKGINSVADNVHDEVVIDVSETASGKLNGRLFERLAYRDKKCDMRGKSE